MANSRRKGGAGERELSRELQRVLGVSCRRTQQFCGAAGDADVVGVPGLHLECKRVERLNLYDAMEQAVRDANEGSVPTVATRRNRKPWVICVRLDDLPELVRRLSDIL